MVEDKYSKSWRESQKTKETFSYFADITHDELKDKVKKHVEEKSKEPIELGEYFYIPSFFTDREKNTPVEMVYRYLTKDKALTRLNASKDGKQFAPRKEYYQTFEQPIPVPVTDYAQQAEHRAKGLQILTSNLVGSNGAIFYDPEGKMCLLMGKVFKVEL